MLKKTESSMQVDSSWERDCKISKQINIPWSCHGNLFEPVWLVSDQASIFETGMMIIFGTWQLLGSQSRDTFHTLIYWHCNSSSISIPQLKRKNHNKDLIFEVFGLPRQKLIFHNVFCVPSVYFVFKHCPHIT